jgi:hypothetical protein
VAPPLLHIDGGFPLADIAQFLSIPRLILLLLLTSCLRIA